MSSTVVCGDLTLHWLSPATPLSDDELRRGVHPDEWTQAQGWRAAVRREEYLRSRWLIRQLSGYRGVLGKSAAGAPVWPPGLVGSLTHKDGFIALALVAASEWLSLGIDVEDPARMQLSFASRICTPADEQWLTTLARGDDERRRWLLTLLFSCKEALFKAVFPLGETLFYFHDAEVHSVDEPNARIALRLLRTVSPETPAGSVLTGSYLSLVSDGRTFVLTSVGIGRTISGGTGSESCG